MNADEKRKVFVELLDEYQDVISSEFSYEDGGYEAARRAWLNKYDGIKEPLIKDEKIRKAVRAWAEASGITKVTSYGDIFWLGFRSVNTESVWKFECFYTDTKEFKLDKEYTIAELCGEEEE